MRVAVAFLSAGATLLLAFPASAAERDTTLVMPALAAPVRIVTDRNGIPHVQAASLPDLYFAWGLVAARDRMWQLEVSRRAGQGRLWEWFGNRSLRGDGGAQLFEFAAHARQVWERDRSDPATRVALERFSAGINAWLALCRSGTRPWAPEFTRLGRTPEDWKPEDSVQLLYGMGVLLDLAIPELAEGDSLRVHGAGWFERRRRFENEHLYTSIPDSAAARLYGGSMPGAGPAGGGRGGRERIPQGAGPGAPIGSIPTGDRDDQRASNVFAVNAGRSAHGAPLLANDMHLTLTAPAQLHVIHVTVPGVVDAAGACVPGLPIIVSGRNRDCAWGITSLDPDVIDLYADTLSADSRRVRWRGGWAPVREADYTMRFQVLGVRLPVLGQKRRYTPHGPVIAIDARRHIAYAARWTALEARMTVRDLLGLERSRSADELAARARTLTTPTVNVIAADAAGHVRYQTVGATPRRPFDFGYGPIPSDGHHEWRGLIAAGSMPAWDVPKRGYVVSSNNLPVGNPYPEVLPRFDWIQDRAARIGQRLAGDDHVTLADMASVQNDVHSRAADRLLPRMIACAESAPARLTPAARVALDSLRAWDHLAYKSRVAPTLFRAWLGALNRRSGLGDVPGMLQAALEGRAPEAFHGPGGPSESAAFAATASLDTAVAALASTFGPSLSSWTYARAHRARFSHSLAWLAPALQPPTLPVDGDNSTPCVGPSRLPWDISVTHAPVWRHVVDLSIPDSSLCAIPPGNQGDGPHARDQLARWERHDYVPLYLSWDRIETAKESEWRLAPR